MSYFASLNSGKSAGVLSLNIVQFLVSELIFQVESSNLNRTKPNFLLHSP